MIGGLDDDNLVAKLLGGQSCFVRRGQRTFRVFGGGAAAGGGSRRRCCRRLGAGGGAGSPGGFRFSAMRCSEAVQNLTAWPSARDGGAFADHFRNRLFDLLLLDGMFGLFGRGSLPQALP